MILSDAAIRNRITVFVLVLLIVIFGGVSYATLPRESAPDVKIPNIIITTADPTRLPKDIEKDITNEIENELSGLKGMKEITSVSASGISMITVEFEPNVDIDDALQRVKDKVDLAKPELPQDTDDPIEPVVDEINVAEFPIMLINLYGPISEARLKDIAEELEDRIEAIPGVLEVDVIGALEREIRIEVDPDRLAQYNLTIEELVSLVPTENVNRSAGGLETDRTKFSIRVPAEIVEPQTINKLLLTERDGRPIYLSDIANVRDAFKDRDSYSRLNGQSSITISVKKRIGENIVEIAEQVKVLLDEAQNILPEGVNISIISDQSDDIRMMILDLENNILTGLVLVVVVLFAFMGLRSSLIVALAIPMSMLMSFAIIQTLGLTLNMIVLFSLILALGMLVDNAIVITENIYRHREMGYNGIEASMKGTAEVAWPVIASTATTIAAFAPLLFWPGTMGDFMKYLPMTVIIVLSSSLFVAMIITPVVCSIFGGKPRRSEDKRRPEGGFLHRYRSVLHVVLAHPVATIILATCMLLGIVITYGRLGRGIELFPDIDPKQAIINLRFPQGTNIRHTNAVAKQVESLIDPYRTRDGETIIDDVVANVGSTGSFSFGGNVGGDHEANITVVFPDYEERVQPSLAMLPVFRDTLKQIVGCEVKVEKQEEGPPTGEPVEVQIIGRNLETLKAVSEQAKKLIADTPGLVNLRSDLEAEKPELIFVPDRDRAKLLNTNTILIADFLQSAVFGRKVGEFREYNDTYDITIRLPLEQRKNIEDLLRLRVPSLGGEAVPLSSLGTFQYRPGLGTIRHVDKKRVVRLTAGAEGRLDTEVLADVQQRLATMNLPEGVTIRYAGQKEDQEESQAFLGKAFGLALLLIVMILVTQFNTFSAPLIIIGTVVLSTIGVFVGLLVTDLPFGIIMTGVGVISLAGVVVNNAIVLLDYTRQLQRRGLDVVAAAVEAGATRLRPVLLTAATTILGLVPMATGVSLDFHTLTIDTRSESSQWWQSMASSVIFGLGFATMLTLLVVPALYVMFYRIAARFGMGGLQHATDAETVDSLNLEDY